MKRLFTLIALLGLLVGVFAGCNPSSSDNSSSATNAPAAPAGTNK